jgi:hypothetical protein
MRMGWNRNRGRDGSMENRDRSMMTQAQIGRSHTYSPWNLLWAVHTAAAVTARADGGVHPTERLALESYLRRCEIEDLKLPLARGLFDKCLREVERNSGRERPVLVSALAGFGGTSMP